MRKEDKYTGQSKYKDDDARMDVYTYIYDLNHTGNSKKLKSNIMGGSHVNMADPVQSMEEVAVKFHKDRGIRLKHLIISFDQYEILDIGWLAEEVQLISDRIGMVYQNIYAIHEDKNTPHVHIMMNTVNHINGYKYNAQQEKAWLVDIVADAMRNLDIDNFRVYGK